MKLNWTEAKMIMQTTSVHLFGVLGFVIFWAISLGDGLAAFAVFFFAAIRARKSPSFLATLNSVNVHGKKIKPLISAMVADSQDGPVNKLMYKSPPIGRSVPTPNGVNANWMTTTWKQNENNKICKIFKFWDMYNHLVPRRKQSILLN